MNDFISEKIRLYNSWDYMEVTFFLPYGEDLMVQLPRESLKMPMINPNIGKSNQHSAGALNKIYIHLIIFIFTL